MISRRTRSKSQLCAALRLLAYSLEDRAKRPVKELVALFVRKLAVEAEGCPERPNGNGARNLQAPLCLTNGLL